MTRSPSRACPCVGVSDSGAGHSSLALLRGVSAAASGRRAGADALLHSIALSVSASGGSSSPGGRDGCSMRKRGPFSVHRELCLAATLCATMSMGCGNVINHKPDTPSSSQAIPNKCMTPQKGGMQEVETCELFAAKPTTFLKHIHQFNPSSRQDLMQRVDGTQKLGGMWVARTVQLPSAAPRKLRRVQGVF